MVEYIIMVGVVGNFLLQLHWYLWSRKVHKRKHFTDDKEVVKGEIQKVKTKSLDGYVATPKSKDEVFSAEKRFDPDTIEGQFDSFFKN